MEQIPEKVIALASAIRDCGGRALLVGGCVRDQLMDLKPFDWDLEIYGVEPANVRTVLDQFGPVNVVGESFTVYKLGHDLDVSLPRRERKVGRGHKAFVVEGDPWMSVADATRRRDFTINAVLMDPLTKEIIDPFYGSRDIENRVLRAVAIDTFPEDSLRVLRAAQFASRFQFNVEPQTVELCRSIELDDLPSERIWGEIEKLLLLSSMPSIGLKWLRELNVIEKLFPEINRLIGVTQDPVWHPEGDVFEHTLLVVDVARQLIDGLSYAKKVTVMLAALAHDFGKPATTKFQDGHWRSLGHAEAGVGATERFLDRLNINTLENYNVRHQVIALVKDHLKPGEFFKKRDEVGEGAFRRLARRCEPELLYRVAKADSLGRNADWVPREKWFDSKAQEWFIERARELQVDLGPPEPILLGRHLLEMGLKPGVRIGEITSAIYEMQLDGRVRSIEEAKSAARTLIGEEIAD
ncbi:MAG TPA: HD domain-containing protein [Pyrinomonadaceae bacterium]|nr:HD domain-containing protein [Pyrinomonadaceae bacterium]